MNWAVFGISVSAVLAAFWAWQLTKKRWDWAGLYASFGCLVGACLNAAAPVRGFTDPDYIGYRFGLVSSEKGIGVSLLAGGIFLVCGASALLAASRNRGRELWMVAATCAAMFAIIGVPTLQQAFQDPASNSIQFGEYLTIPGVLATLISLLLLTVPYAVGAVWAAKAASRSD